MFHEISQWINSHVWHGVNVWTSMLRNSNSVTTAWHTCPPVFTIYIKNDNEGVLIHGVAKFFPFRYWNADTIAIVDCGLRVSRNVQPLFSSPDKKLQVACSSGKPKRLHWRWCLSFLTSQPWRVAKPFITVCSSSLDNHLHLFWTFPVMQYWSHSMANHRMESYKNTWRWKSWDQSQ